MLVVGQFGTIPPHLETIDLRSRVIVTVTRSIQGNSQGNSFYYCSHAGVSEGVKYWAGQSNKFLPKG